MKVLFEVKCEKGRKTIKVGLFLKRFLINFLCLMIYLFLFSIDSSASSENKSKGFVAEVIDIHNSSVLLEELSFGYVYSGRLNNCIGNCGYTSSDTLEFLPLNKNCGAAMVPFNNISSISMIKNGRAMVNFIDGKNVEMKFGSFYKWVLKDVKGRATLGDFSLPLEKVSKIVFRHEDNRNYLSKDSEFWGCSKGGLRVRILCRSGGDPINLNHVYLYEPSDRGLAGRRYDESYIEKLKVKVGEAEYQVPTSKIYRIQLIKEDKKDSSTKYPIIFATRDGQEVRGILLENENKYLGGYTEDGYFYYEQLIDLARIESLD